MDPQTIKIAGIGYEVKEVENLEDQFNLLGQILYTRGIIQLEKNLPPDRKVQVFVHEVLHGIFFEAGYEEQDEEMIDRVAKVLYQVLKDNNIVFERGDG